MSENPPSNPNASPNSIHQSSSGAGPTASSAKVSNFRGNSAPRARVASYFDDEAIRVDIDGNPVRSRSSESFEAQVSRRPIDEKILLDEIIEFCRGLRLPFKRVDIMRAIKLELLDRAEQRRVEILRPLCEAPLSGAERVKAIEEFNRFAQIIDMPPALSIAALRQFMWLFFRKQTRKSVHYPIMLFFFNEVQGSGKSWFIERLLKPLHELASDPVPFSEIADVRSTGLQKNGVVWVDDAGGAVPPKFLGAFKARISVASSKTRVLGQSRQSRQENDAVFIATTNVRLHRLIPDDTGHRRFVEMPFKNGAEEKGGSKEGWKLVEDLDYELMWKSVSEQSDAPIIPFLNELNAYQQGCVPPDPLEAWLSGLDFDRDAVRDVTSPYGITPNDLRALYRFDTGTELSETAFGKAMNVLVEKGTTPVAKKRTAEGFFYNEKP